MTASHLAVLLVAFGTSAYGESSRRAAAPAYSATSIVHSATNRPGPFAPNTVVSIYGTDLSYNTETAAPKDNVTPDKAAGVQVLANGTPAPLLYVSPAQINFIIPASFVEGTLEVRVVREGTSGPAVKFNLDALAPGLFQVDGGPALAAHPDGSVVTAEQPARPGESIVLYAAGLGYTALQLRDGEVPWVPPLTAANLAIKRQSDLRILLDGKPLETASVTYAGLMPGYAALYHIKVNLPADTPVNPEVRIAIGESISPEGVKLLVQPQPSAPAARLTSR